eukprot:jgi/Psemu1/201328/e_gw1.277.54.1
MSSKNNEDIEGGEYIQEDADSTTFLCCGVCDMRITTMFVNGFNLTMILVGVLAMAIRSNLFWKTMGATFAAGIPGIVLSGIGFYGAKNLELWAMYLATAGFAVSLVADAVFHYWVGFFCTAVTLFPHAVLTFEMHKGFITKSNYEEQQYVSPEGMEFVDRVHSRFLSPVP